MEVPTANDVKLTRELVKSFGFVETRDKNGLAYVRNEVWLFYTPDLDKNGFQVVFDQTEEDLKDEENGFFTEPCFIYTVEDLFSFYQIKTGNPLVLVAN